MQRQCTATVANEAAQLEVAIAAAGLDPAAGESYPIWTLWQTQGLRAALAALSEERIMTVDAPASAAEQLAATQAALTKARDKRRRVEHLATSGDYSTRAAARVQLEDVTADVAGLESEIGPLQLAADREATIAELVRLAADGRAALADIEAVYADLAQALLPLLERYSDAVRQQSQARTAFYDALAELAPEARSLRADHTSALAILAELDQTGADCSGVLVNMTAPISRALDRPYESPALFPGALRIALQEEATRRLGYPVRGDVVMLPAMVEA